MDFHSHPSKKDDLHEEEKKSKAPHDEDSEDSSDPELIKKKAAEKLKPQSRACLFSYAEECKNINKIPNRHKLVIKTVLKKTSECGVV